MLFFDRRNCWISFLRKERKNVHFLPSPLPCLNLYPGNQGDEYPFPEHLLSMYVCRRRPSVSHSRIEGIHVVDLEAEVRMKHFSMRVEVFKS